MSKQLASTATPNGTGRRPTSFVTRHPWKVILAWFVIGTLLAVVAQWKFSDVTTDDTAHFLPSSSESAHATEYGQQAFGQAKGAPTVTVLVKPRDGGRLDAADRRAAERVTAGLNGWRPDWKTIENDPPEGAFSSTPNDRQRETRVVAAEAGELDPGGRFTLAALQFKGNVTDPFVQAAFAQLRTEAGDRFAEHDLKTGFTGGVASVADNKEANKDTEALAGLLLLGSIVLLNLLFFRSVLAAIVPLLAVYIVGGAAAGLVVGGASLLGVTLDTGTPTLVSTVLIGIGIDYFLFLIFRFREQLRTGQPRREAAAAAAARVNHVIASAALAVVAAFATLGLAEFGQFQVLGPAIAASVLVMLVAGVTLMPALLSVTGRAFFWPSRSWRRDRTDGFAARLGALVGRRPGLVAAVSAGALAVLSVGALGATMNYDLSSDAKGTESARVTAQIDRALPRGATDPQTVYVRGDRELTIGELGPMRRELKAVPGVAQVTAPILSKDRQGAAIGVALEADSTSERGLETASGPLRDAAHETAPADTEALVGGRAAVFADVSDSIDRDLKLIFPVAAGLILLIMVGMLRSVVAPLYMLVAVGLEFAATLGATVLVYQGAMDEPGVAFTMPLVLFLFVVALGTDYNMLVAGRLREEMRSGRSVPEAVAEAVRHSAPTIAAAALILASSFATLMLSSDPGQQQMGFAMAAGILIASLVVSILLVPALTALFGERAWWAPQRQPALPEPQPARA